MLQPLRVLKTLRGSGHKIAQIIFCNPLYRNFKSFASAYFMKQISNLPYIFRHKLGNKSVFSKKPGLLITQKFSSACLSVCFCFVMLVLLTAFSGNSHRSEKTFFIRNAEIAESLTGSARDFPKYTSQIINLANQNAQATRPKAVGQLSELIQEFPGKEYEEWVKWYTAQNPEAIDQAAEKIYDMIVKLRTAMEKIDKPLVKQWAENLILTQSYAGLRFQKSILKQIADAKKTSFRLANPDEEAKGIDGYIGEMPVSVKPVTYKSKPMLPEQIEVKIIYYEKKKSGIKVFYDF